MNDVIIDVLEYDPYNVFVPLVDIKEENINYLQEMELKEAERLRRGSNDKKVVKSLLKITSRKNIPNINIKRHKREKLPDNIRALFKHIKHCQCCGICDTLQIHHKDKNHLNNDVSNLIKVCVKCHLNYHKNDKYYKFLKKSRIDKGRYYGTT